MDGRIAPVAGRAEMDPVELGRAGMLVPPALTAEWWRPGGAFPGRPEPAAGRRSRVRGATSVCDRKMLFSKGNWAVLGTIR
jgi:hypothetical protein